MDYSQAFAISAAGMTLERTRVEVAAMNLANASTIQGADGAGFQPMRVLARADRVPGSPFPARVEDGMEDDATSLALPRASVEPALVAPRRVYEPGNPFADGGGFVTYPGVDTATEMINLMTAVRAYEANVAAMNAARTMVLKALDIGGAA